jgi:hypothetical protein
MKLLKIDMRFGTWSVRSLYRSGSLITVAKEISKCKLDLVGEQIRWDRGGTETAEENTFFYGKGNENHELGTVFFFVNKRITSPVKMVDFVSDRMSYIISRGCWCASSVLNVHSPTEYKTDDMKDSFYEELEGVIDKIPK